MTGLQRVTVSQAIASTKSQPPPTLQDCRNPLILKLDDDDSILERAGYDNDYDCNNVRSSRDAARTTGVVKEACPYVCISAKHVRFDNMNKTRRQRPCPGRSSANAES